MTLFEAEYISAPKRVKKEKTAKPEKAKKPRQSKVKKLVEPIVFENNFVKEELEPVVAQIVAAPIISTAVAPIEIDYSDTIKRLEARLAEQDAMFELQRRNDIPASPPPSETRDDSAPPAWFKRYISTEAKRENAVKEKKERKPVKQVKEFAALVAEDQWRDTGHRIREAQDSHQDRLYRMIHGR